MAEIAVELGRRHQGVVGCIAYGSCLRSGDVFDGLTDFYVIVGEYLQAYRAVTPSLFNWLIRQTSITPSSNCQVALRV